MDDREAMKLALKDLERYESALHKARATIREALAEQPAQQEPVAKYMGKTYRCPIVNLYQDIPVGTLLYTTPAQRTWVGLTPEEVQEIHDTYHKRMGPQEFASMVEAKLKEKNQ